MERELPRHGRVIKRCPEPPVLSEIKAQLADEYTSWEDLDQNAVNAFVQAEAEFSTPQEKPAMLVQNRRPLSNRPYVPTDSLGARPRNRFDKKLY